MALRRPCRAFHTEKSLDGVKRFPEKQKRAKIELKRFTPAWSASSRRLRDKSRSEPGLLASHTGEEPADKVWIGLLGRVEADAPTSTYNANHMQLEVVQRGHTARQHSLRRGLALEFFTVGWNVLEAAVGIAAGLTAGSVALIGFALDSVVEASSGGILIWRLRTEDQGTRSAEEAERRAIRLVGVAFLALAVYVGGRAAVDLVTQSRPNESISGIVLAAVSLIVMPVLAWRKRLVARELDSRALQADSTQTTLCTYLSAFLLVGLVTNAAFGWWWADPVAGLAIAGFAAKEGRELWTAKDLCCR